MTSQAARESGPTEPCRTTALKPVHSVHGRLLLTVISELPNPPPLLLPTTSGSLVRRLAYVLIAHQSSEVLPAGNHGDPACQNILQIRLPAAVSAHSTFLLYNILPRAIPFVKKHLAAGEDVCVACPTGKDLGPGVIVAALGLFFSDDGELYGDDADNKGEPAGEGLRGLPIECLQDQRSTSLRYENDSNGSSQATQTSTPPGTPSSVSTNSSCRISTTHTTRPPRLSLKLALDSNTQVRGCTLNPASVQKISMRNDASIPSLNVDGTMRYSPRFIVTNGVTTPEIASE